MKTQLLLVTLMGFFLGSVYADSPGNTLFWKLSFKDPIISSKGELVFEHLSPGTGPEGQVEIQATGATRGGKSYGLEDIGSSEGNGFLKANARRKSYFLVKCPDNTGIENDDYSLALWFKPGEELEGHIVVNRTTPPYWSAALNRDGKIIVNFNGYSGSDSSGKTISVRSKGRVDPSAWNHIAVVVERNQSIVIYLNGQLETISSPIDKHTGAMPPSLFLAGAYEPYLSGQLGEVCLYRGKLSEDEVSKLAANPPSKP